MNWDNIGPHLSRGKWLFQEPLILTTLTKKAEVPFSHGRLTLHHLTIFQIFHFLK